LKQKALRENKINRIASRDLWNRFEKKATFEPLSYLNNKQLIRIHHHHTTKICQ